MKNKKLIVSAGRSRSGSTLLYNLIRLTIINTIGKRKVYARSWRYYNKYNPKEFHIVKIHGNEPYLFSNATHIFSCFRNEVDQRKSIIKFRKIIKEQTLTKRELDDFVKYDFNRYTKWKSHKNFIREFNYDILITKKSVILDISKIFKLDIDNEIINKIISDIDNLKLPKEKFDKETCLTPNHFTSRRK